MTPRPLTEQERQCLLRLDWATRAGTRRGVWVSVREQRLRVLDGGTVLFEAPCSTSARGTGSLEGSYKTPLGWHAVAGKTGDGAPWGQVFRGGKPIEQVWTPGEATDDDLILTRILFLEGREPGINQGGNVDTFARKIYIHGTNAESSIGSACSHGCVRLRNDDIIALYDLLSPGAPVLISEE